MKLIVFSSDHPGKEEAEWVNRLFAEGLEFYHLKKRSISKRDTKLFIENIEFKYHPRIILHQHYNFVKKYNLGGIHVNRKLRKTGVRGWIRHIKNRMLFKGKILSATCHRLESLSTHSKYYDMLIYSPLYKLGLSGKMEPTLNPNVTQSLSIFQTNTIIAMGGISDENIKETVSFGFKGIAVSSGIWNQDKSPVESYLAMIKKINPS